ncbi:MAG: hypothetical protein KBF88_10430, partial [Polyangiaceae bacterium]|nr:hypothetical protein [Polyangiaceae bacterium]
LWPGVKSKNGVAIYRFMPAGNFNTAARSNYWARPSIHDLDDDGLPEIVVEGAVLNGQTGALRSANPVGYTQVNLGTHPVLANLDQDARIELTNGRAIWEFDGATNQWIADGTYNAVSTAAAWTAVADFNPYDNLKKPEIVARDNFGLSIYSTDHTLFLGTRAVIPGGGGGAPTIADFDGDGLPEVGVAGSDYYTVFDPDCQAVPRTGGLCDRTTPKCEHVPGTNLCPNFMLWSRKTQDHSSNITGSTVFDFEADGKAEVVYGDECFTRVYSGSSGKVLFSQYRSSCTWLEYPIVADVDGNLRADLVVPSNTACGPAGVGIACEGLDANGVDAQFAGLICEKNTDCQSGTCDQGLCRCTTSSQCCGEKDDAKCNDFGYKCAPPPVGTPGTGNTCRASHPKGLSGIRVYRDAADRWVRSRSIWNQHAYAVTHVNEDGTVPKTSVWANNWTTAGLNNFRQNVPGTRDARALGDVTAQVAGYTCSSGNATLSIPICNRGAAPVGKGVPVGFYSGNTKVCSAVTMNTLDIGKCETVSCIWENAPSDAAPVDVIVKANDGAGSAECYSSNNNGSIPRVGCKALQ